MSLHTVLRDRIVIDTFRQHTVAKHGCCKTILLASSCDSAVHEGQRHGYQTCDFLRLAVDFELLDLHALSNVSAASTATSAYALQSANLRNLLQRKVEEERNFESHNLMRLTLDSKKWRPSSTA